MAAIDKKVRQLIASLDDSHLFQENWLQMLRNIILVLLIAITVWCLCASLEYVVSQLSERLIGPYRDNHQITQSIERNNIIIADHVKIESNVRRKESYQTMKAHHYIPWILLGLMLAGGIIRGFLIRLPSWKDAEGDGSDTSVEYFHDTYSEEKNPEQAAISRYKMPTFLHAIRRYIMTCLTLAVGGSGGLEGPVIPIGEAIAAGWGKLFRVHRADNLRAMQMAGIAAAVGTLLHAPIAAAIFAAELVFYDRIVYRTLLYSLIATMLVYELNNHFLLTQPLFSVGPHPKSYSIKEYLEVSLVAILISAPAGFGVHYVFEKLKNIFSLLPVLLRAPIGALLTVAIALLIWHVFSLAPYNVLGFGEETVRQALNGTGSPMLNIWWVIVIVVIARTFTTGFTLMSGGSAGLLIPAMFMGGMSGDAIFHLLAQFGLVAAHDGASIFIISGIAAALVAIIEVPISIIIMVIEIFGLSFGPPAIISVVVCHKFAERFRLYRHKS